MQSVIPQYEVVIPHFHNVSQLGFLLEHIRVGNSYAVPSRVIVVDDCSGNEVIEQLRSIRSKMIALGLNVSILALPQQIGMFPAIREGLSHVRSPYVVVCVDDIRLLLKTKGQYRTVTMPNPFCTLVHYLDQGQKAHEADPDHINDIGLVFPFVLRWEQFEVVHTADRSIYSIKKNVHPLISNHKFGYHIQGMIKPSDVHHLEFFEVSLGHRYCFALNMNLYRKVGGFDKELDPYPYGLEDLCLRMRKNGVASYMTSQASVFHKFERGEKPAGSLSNMFELDDRIELVVKMFYDKWGNFSPAVLNKNINEMINLPASILQ